jgi:hypothetical protein
MATVNAKVMEMVQREIQADSSVTNETLFERAKTIDRKVGKLSKREFNARYPLQVRRRIAPARRRRSAPAADRKAEARRAAVRKILLDYGKAIAAAEGKADMVDLIAGLDSYVDRLVAAAR